MGGNQQKMNPDLSGSVSSQDIHRMLPQSQDSELGILGSILLCPKVVMGECVERGITPEHFHVPAHGIIYTVLRELYDADRPIDFILLTHLLKDRQLLDKVGGPAFVTGLFTFVPTAANANYYLEIIKEKYTFRQAILLCNEFGALAYEDGVSACEFLDRLENRVSAIGQYRTHAAKFNLKEEVMSALDNIEKLYERKGSISGIATGFVDFDKMTDGLHAAEMIVIAARPSMGKTALAMNIAEHVAITQGIPVGVFSLEMSTQQLMQRMICSRAKVNCQNVRDGFLSSNDFQTMSLASVQIAQGKMVVDDAAGLNILELRARARKWKREMDIQLIVIDYLQLLKGATKRAQENRQLEIGEISAGIKGLAKELKLPIIVLAQLNRNPEARAGGIPKLADLRESGNIEQDGDLIAFIHRPEVYASDDDAKKESQGQATLIIAKQRNGPVGDVPLTFIKEITRFETRAKNYGLCVK